MKYLRETNQLEDGKKKKSNSLIRTPYQKRA